MARQSSLTLDSGELQVTFDPKSAAFDIVQKQSGTVWKMDRSDRKDLAVELHDDAVTCVALSDARRVTSRRTLSGAIYARYEDFNGLDSPISVTILLELDGADVSVELDVDDADPGVRFDSLYYPRGFSLPKSNDAYWIVPLKGGRLTPATYRKNIDARLGWKPTLKCHGAVQGDSGFLCLWHTPFDVLLAETNSVRTGPKYFPRNMESLGRFREKRRYTFSFREKTGYVDLIRNVYRPHADRLGYLVTLEDRIADKPRIRDLPGTLVFHQIIAYLDRRHFEKRYVTFDHARTVFETMVKRTGVKKGLYHLDGWCRQGYDALHPDVLPPLNEAGGEAGLGALSRSVTKRNFHFGLHDNYLLFFPDAEQYDDDAAVFDRRLKPHRDDFRAGGMNFVMSPPAAKKFVMKNYITGQNYYRRRWRPITEYCELGFCYFDQFLHSGGGHDQDFNPLHPLTREQFIRGMLDIIDIMGKRLKVITSSEHMFEFAMPHYDINGNNTGVALKTPADGWVPVPLWNLAFHECMVPTDFDGSAAGIIKTGLIGGVVHHRPANKYYDDDGESLQREVDYINASEPIRKLHEEVCFRQCTGSRLLSADGSVQEADYDGITVHADLNKLELTVSGSKHADGTFTFSHLPA